MTPNHFSRRLGLAEAFPVEESRARSSYVVRADVPGLDPVRDITVVVADNEVTIEVRRPLRGPGSDNGLFHEPAIKRRILLPRGARDETLTATYHTDGVLELVVDPPRSAGSSRSARNPDNPPKEARHDHSGHRRRR